MNEVCLHPAGTVRGKRNRMIIRLEVVHVEPLRYFTPINKKHLAFVLIKKIQDLIHYSDNDSQPEEEGSHAADQADQDERKISKHATIVLPETKGKKFQKTKRVDIKSTLASAPGRTRICNFLLRKQTLCPIALLGRCPTSKYTADRMNRQESLMGERAV